MKIDVLKILEAAGAKAAIMKGKIVMPCPLSDHGGENINIWVNPSDGAGLCAKCGEKPFDEVLAACMATKAQKAEVASPGRELKDKFKVMPWQEFAEIPFPENAWRVKGLVPVSGVTIIAAPSGEKKSWLCMELAKCVAEGHAFLDNPNLSVEQCKVLYVENESPKDEIQRRGKMLGFQNDILVLSQDCPPLNEDKAVNELLKVCIDQGVGLLFIDTVRSVAGGLQEEKAELVRAFFDRFKKFSEFGITVIMTDHLRKPNRFESQSVPRKDQLLGSQDKVAAVNALISIRSEAGSDEVAIYPLKLKSGKEATPFIAKMSEDQESKSISFAFGGEVQEKALKVERAKEVIKEFLAQADGPQDAQHIIEAVKDANVGKTNAEIALKQMRNDQEIGAEKSGNKWMYFIAPSEHMADENDEQAPMPDLFEAAVIPTSATEPSVHEGNPPPLTS